jgi:8-hydroxy-5-deazaflavin:NADPH oxidoreductase
VTLDLQTCDSLTVPTDSSAAAEIAAALRTPRVLKAFNTNSAATLAAGTTGEAPATVLIAGDDKRARGVGSGRFPSRPS